MSSSEREENLIEHISYHVANVYNNHVHFDTCSMIHGLCTISPPAFRRSGGLMFKMAVRSLGFYFRKC